MPYLVLRLQPRKTHIAHVREEHVPSPRWNLEGDVIQILPSTHKFSDTELTQYGIVKVPSVPKKARQLLLLKDHEQLRPRRFRFKPLHLLALSHGALNATLDPASHVPQAKVPTLTWSKLGKIVWDRQADQFQDLGTFVPPPEPADPMGAP